MLLFSVNFGRKLPKGKLTLVGIRDGEGRIHVSVNGSAPVSRMAMQGVIALDGPQKAILDQSMNPGAVVHRVQVGSGWPQDVPRPLTVKELLP